MEFPFKESKIEGNLYLREFEESVDIDDLEWHRDREDRIVEIIGTTDWQLQMDNELPKKIEKNSIIEIPPYVYHRVIKGDGDLIVSIKES